MSNVRKKSFILLMIFMFCCTLALYGLSTQSESYVYANELTTYEITEQTGLGQGINVITAESLNDFKLGYSILDTTALSEISVGRINLNENNAISFSSTQIQNIISYSEYSFGAGLEEAAFIASIALDFETNASFNYEDYQYKYFYIFQQYINRYQAYITNYLQKSTYANAFSESFLDDLALLESGNLSYEVFFNRYGTHLVGTAIFGGKLRATYSVVSNTIMLNEDMKASIDVVLSENLSSSTASNIIANINAYYNEANKYNLTNINTAFSLTAHGGTAIVSNNIENFNSSYEDWCESFNNVNNSVLIDYNSEGLVALWDILPDSYSNVAVNMKNKFIELYSNAENELMTTFKTGNYVDFSGGTGVQSDPYLISEPWQMMNIEKFMDASYKLENDINLSGYSQWNAIGGHYKNKVFNGVFDGDGYSIQSLTRTEDITEANNRVYFGLFGCIGSNGIVKNLTFISTNVAMVGPGVNNGNTRAFFGIVAGSCLGTIENVVTYGTLSFDCCTNGVSYLGSMAGNTHNATIKNCENFATIFSGRYSSVAGGLVGYANGTNFNTCENYGAVSAKCTGWGGYATTGGIVGEIFENLTHESYDSNNFYECINSGTLVRSLYGWGIGYNHITGEIYAGKNTVYLI